MHKQSVFTSVATLVFVLATVGAADCAERTSSGSGVSEQSVEVWHGQRRSTTTWKNSRIKTTWDPDTRKDTRVEEASEEAVAKPEDGSAPQEATATGPNVKAVGVSPRIAPARGSAR